MAGARVPIANDAIAAGTARAYDVTDDGTIFGATVFRDFDGNTLVLHISSIKTCLRATTYTGDSRVCSFEDVRKAIADSNPKIKAEAIPLLDASVLAFVSLMFNGTLDKSGCTGTGPRTTVNVRKARRQLIAGSRALEEAQRAHAKQQQQQRLARESVPPGAPARPTRAPRRNAFAGDFSTKAFVRQLEEGSDVVSGADHLDGNFFYDDIVDDIVDDFIDDDDDDIAASGYIGSQFRAPY